jgi:hypothetical protein
MRLELVMDEKIDNVSAPVERVSASAPDVGGSSIGSVTGLIPRP